MIAHASDAIRVPSTGKPEFVMTGVSRPGGGVRLYASRNLPRDLGWGQREVSYAVVWHIDADLADVLIIDRPTWGEAFTAAWTIWANQDLARQQAIAANESRHQRGHGSLERVAAGSMMPLDYVPYERARELEGGDHDARQAEAAEAGDRPADRRGQGRNPGDHAEEPG